MARNYYPDGRIKFSAIRIRTGEYRYRGYEIQHKIFLRPSTVSAKTVRYPRWSIKRGGLEYGSYDTFKHAKDTVDTILVGWV